MPYETKVLLMAMAQMALKVGSREMYYYIASLANIEGVVLKSYDDAKAELDSQSKQ